jgi:hypothetical protein
MTAGNASGVNDGAAAIVEPAPKAAAGGEIFASRDPLKVLDGLRDALSSAGAVREASGSAAAPRVPRAAVSRADARHPHAARRGGPSGPCRGAVARSFR